LGRHTIKAHDLQVSLADASGGMIVTLEIYGFPIPIAELRAPACTIIRLSIGAAVDE
jgi:hypothetical protein